MIVHEAEGMHLECRLGANFFHGFEEAALIQIVPEDFFPAITPVHDVISRARILDSKFARHAPAGLARPVYCQKESLQPN
jgi:hypothetical protein